jgi:hypothetical protein
MAADARIKPVVTASMPAITPLMEDVAVVHVHNSFMIQSPILPREGYVFVDMQKIPRNLQWEGPFWHDFDIFLIDRFHDETREFRPVAAKVAPEL